MFLLNSRTSLFVATFKSSRSKSFHHRRHPLSLSYGVNLPSSLTLVSLAHLRLLASPTCVGFGTVTLSSTFRSFSRQRRRSEFAELAFSYLTTPGLTHSGFACRAPVGLRPGHSTPGSPDLLRPSITPPRADEPSPGNLRFSVTGILIRFFATHACMVTCMQSTSDPSSASTRIQRSSTTVNKFTIRGFGSVLQSRSSSARYHSTSELLRTL